VATVEEATIADMAAIDMIVTDMMTGIGMEAAMEVRTGATTEVKPG
jgi:hypothetical protein